MTVGLIFLWLLVTFILAAFGKWTPWLASTIAMLMVALAGYFFSGGALWLDVATGMLIWLLPISLLLGALIWGASKTLPMLGKGTR